MNPITAARMRAGLSKAEFCRQMRLSRTFILRAEEGTYDNPGSKLIEFSTNTLGISKLEFRRQYSQFQSQVRQHTKETVQINPLAIDHRVTARDERAVGRLLTKTENDLELELNSEDITRVFMHKIFRQWRENYWGTYINFAKALCVHPASVENYEAGSYNSMPLLMQDALNEIDLIDPSFDPRLRWCYVYTHPKA